MCGGCVVESDFDQYRPGTGVIAYRDGLGEQRMWYFGVAAADNETSIREHAAKHLGTVELLGWGMKRTK